MLLCPSSRTNKIQGPLNTPARAETGGFDIENCNAKETESIRGALRVGRIIADEAATDAANGRFSKYGFWALFKSGRPKVQQMLHNLATLPPMPHVERLGVNQTSSPVFVCASEIFKRKTEFWQVIWQKCIDQKIHRKTKREGIAYQILGGPYIFLCPSFFAQPELVGPNPRLFGKGCPVVRENKYFDPHIATSAMATQTSILLHELVHFYLGPENLPSEKEVYELNQIVGQRAIDSQRTPAAYQYYFACKPRPCCSLLKT